MDGLHKLLGIFFRHLSWGVKPYKLYVTVIARDLLDLRQAFGIKIIVESFGITIFVHPRSSGGAGCGPVLIMGIIEAESESEFFAGIRQFLHRVAAKRSCVHYVEFVALGVIHGETVVMLACDDDIFHAGVFGQLGNLHCVEILRVECTGNIFIFLTVGIGHVLVHKPFAYAVIGFSVPYIGKL